MNNDDRKTVILVSAYLATEGGVTRIAKNLLSSDFGYRYILHDISRPLKYIKYESLSSKELLSIFDAGIKRGILGAIITFKNAFIFPIMLIKNNPTIIHINGVSHPPFWESIYYLILSKLFNKKVVYHYLDSFDLFYNKSNKFSKKLICFFLGLADARIVLSIKIKNLMDKLICSSNNYLIPSSVDVGKFNSINNKNNNSYIECLFLGGIYPLRKGMRDILKSIPVVLEKNKNIKFLFAGGEQVENELKIFIGSDYQDNIEYIGWLGEEDKINIYNNVDILLLPSHDEGLPYVIIEALSSGLPIISTEVGGIPEVIENGVNGFVVKCGDYLSLADKILLLSMDDDLRNIISKANKLKSYKKYDQSKAFSQIKEIYDSLI